MQHIQIHIITGYNEKYGRKLQLHFNIIYMVFEFFWIWRYNFWGKKWIEADIMACLCSGRVQCFIKMFHFVWFSKHYWGLSNEHTSAKTTFRQPPRLMFSKEQCIWIIEDFFFGNISWAIQTNFFFQVSNERKKPVQLYHKKL